MNTRALTEQEMTILQNIKTAMQSMTPEELEARLPYLTAFSEGMLALAGR